MSVKHLGEIRNPILVFGGPYSNLSALLKIKTIAERDRIPSDHIICTGDLVAYCAQPAETVDMIRQWGVHVIAGNVELQLATDANDCGCNFNEGSVCDALSAKWYAFAKQKLSTEHIQWMKTLPEFLRFSLLDRECIAVHGAYTGTSKFVFRSTPWEIKQQEFEQTSTDVIIAGHCGIPFLQHQDDKLWANAGVIGMPPNDGTSLAWYLLITPHADGIRFETKTFAYDAEAAASEILRRNLAHAYAHSLINGIWPSNDILPATEKAEQGKALEEESCLLKPRGMVSV
jgi:predicted phosphodiesterase